MKKRVAAVLLSMVMVMTFMPTMAFATSESQDAPVQKETVTETPETEAGSTDNAKEEKGPTEPEEDKAKASSEEPEAVINEQTAGDEDVSVSSDPPAEAVCGIGETYYNSLNDAKDAVATSTNKTITMVKDTVLNGLVVFGVSQSCTLDLNGYTISREGGWNSIYLDNNASLTVTDSSDDHSGKIFHKGQPTDSTIAAAIYAKGPLTVNGGTIECTYGYAVETDWNGSAEINKGAVIKGAANKSIGVGSHWNRSYKFKINGGRFSDNVGNINLYNRLGNLSLEKESEAENALYGLKFPTPEELAWSEKYPHYATYKWEHKNLEDYLKYFEVVATYKNGTSQKIEEDQSHYYYADFRDFMNDNRDGNYSFSVCAVPKDDYDFIYETASLDPVQFYAVDLKVGNGTGNAGGSVLFKRDGGAERIDDTRTWVYPAGSTFEFEAVPDVGYTFEKYVKKIGSADPTNHTAKVLSFQLEGSTSVTASFNESNAKSTIEVDFGSSHTDLAGTVAENISKKSGFTPGSEPEWPYDMYGPIEATASGSTLTVKFPTASATEGTVYGYVSDVLMEELEPGSWEKPYIDGDEALHVYRAVGKKVIGGQGGYIDEDEVDTEWERANTTPLNESTQESTVSLALNVLWDQRAKTGSFTVGKIVCGTEIEKARHGDGEHGFIYYTQENIPKVKSNSGSDFEVYEDYGQTDAYANLYTTKDLQDAWRLEDYWYVGAIDGEESYITGFMVAPKFGYYVDDRPEKKPTFKVNNQDASLLEGARMPLLLADIDATHDWLFTGFTWKGSDEKGYTGATADYLCKQCSKRESIDADFYSGDSFYKASVTKENSLDGNAHSETKGDAQRVTVTFYADSEGTTILDRYQVEIGDIIGLPSKLPPAQEDATFAGWSKEPGKTAYAKKDNTVYKYVVDAS